LIRILLFLHFSVFNYSHGWRGSCLLGKFAFEVFSVIFKGPISRCLLRLSNNLIDHRGLLRWINYWLVLQVELELLLGGFGLLRLRTIVNGNSLVGVKRSLWRHGLLLL
jgi:hypothetical protein